jgi:hypothetical protein
MAAVADAVLGATLLAIGLVFFAGAMVHLIHLVPALLIWFAGAPLWAVLMFLFGC